MRASVVRHSTVGDADVESFLSVARAQHFVETNTVSKVGTLSFCHYIM